MNNPRGLMINNRIVSDANEYMIKVNIIQMQIVDSWIFVDCQLVKSNWWFHSNENVKYSSDLVS